MKREEAKKEIVIHNTETYPYNIRDNVDEVIDEIYNDFESRVCENCIEVHNPCSIAQEAFHDHGHNLDNFGCNKFERKT